MEPDEISALKLDEEFKNNLELIRPHVLSMNSVHEAHLVRLWLEKLSNCPTGDRVIRNEYLSELCYQVERGWLQIPFNKPPPSTPLPSLLMKTVKGILPQPNGNSSSSSDYSGSTSVPSYCPASNMIFKQHGGKLPHLYEMSYVVNGRLKNYPQTYWQYDPQPKAKKRNCLYTETVKRLPTKAQESLILGNNHKKSKEDLVKTVTSLKAIIKDLQKQNDILTKAQCQRSASLGSENVANDIKTLAKDISTLKSELIELQRTKVALEIKHTAMVAQYQKDVNTTMAGLSQRLHEAQNRNNYMEKSIQIIMQQIKKIESHEMNKWQKVVLKEAAVFRSKLSELRKNHLEKVEEFESVVNSLTKELNDKTNEILRLEKLLKGQCSKMQEEVMDIHKGMEESSKATQMKFQTKVKNLKRTVLKYERYSHKMRNYYEKMILELANQWKTEVKGLKLQMKTQKAIISTALTEENQNELEKLVLKLEECYRLLLTDSEARASKQKQEDWKRILELEVKLSVLKTSKSDPTCKNISLHSL